LFGFSCFGTTPVYVSVQGSELEEFGIYISPNDSDSNPGIKNLPLKSLEKANEIASSVHRETPDELVTVNVEDGIYQLAQVNGST